MTKKKTKRGVKMTTRLALVKTYPVSTKFQVDDMDIATVNTDGFIDFDWCAPLSAEEAVRLAAWLTYWSEPVPEGTNL